MQNVQRSARRGTAIEVSLLFQVRSWHCERTRRQLENDLEHEIIHTKDVTKQMKQTVYLIQQDRKVSL